VLADSCAGKQEGDQVYTRDPKCQQGGGQQGPEEHVQRLVLNLADATLIAAAEGSVRKRAQQSCPQQAWQGSAQTNTECQRQPRRHSKGWHPEQSPRDVAQILKQSIHTALQASGAR
jgi:hypothetical protein